MSITGYKLTLMLENAKETERETIQQQQLVAELTPIEALWLSSLSLTPSRDRRHHL